MNINITICCNNRGFHEGHAEIEVARILRATAERLDDESLVDVASIPLRDEWGNYVGKLEIDEGDDRYAPM